jgi:hypothetical protein
MEIDTYNDSSGGLISVEGPERDDVLRQADLVKAERVKLLNRRRQAAFRERRRERLLSLPAGILPLPDDPGAGRKSRGGESRSAKHSAKYGLDIAITNWCSKHDGYEEFSGGLSRVNRRDQTFVLFTHREHGYCLVRFMGAVEISRGKKARDMFDKLRRLNVPKELKDGRTAYIEDALEVLTKPSGEDRRVEFETKIHHYDRDSGYEFGFLIWLGALRKRKHKTYQAVLSDRKFLSEIDQLVRIAGNPYLNQHNFLNQSNLIATAYLNYDETRGHKLHVLRKRIWATTTFLRSFSKIFTDTKEFAWVREVEQFENILEAEEASEALNREVSHHKFFERSEITALMSAAIRNGDGNPEGTRTGAATFAMRCSIAVRPSELDRLRPEQFCGIYLRSKENVTKTNEAKSVGDPRAPILARILRHETFMPAKDMRREFEKLKMGRRSIFEGAFTDPKTAAKDLCSYGLRATAVTHLCYIATVALSYEYDSKFVWLTREEVAKRTSHRSTLMIDTRYGQLNGEMSGRPDPRDFYGFSESHGKFIIKLKNDPEEYIASDYDTLYDCFLLKTWLAAWRAVDPDKAAHYARLAVEELKMERSLTSKKVYVGKAQVEEF